MVLHASKVITTRSNRMKFRLSKQYIACAKRYRYIFTYIFFNGKSQCQYIANKQSLPSPKKVRRLSYFIWYERGTHDKKMAKEFKDGED